MCASWVCGGAGEQWSIAHLHTPPSAVGAAVECCGGMDERSGEEEQQHYQVQMQAALHRETICAGCWREMHPRDGSAAAAL